MSEHKHVPDEAKKVRKLVDEAFGEETGSAAKLGEERLGRYSNIAVKMFHTSVLPPREMALPAIGQFASKVLKGLEAYRLLYFVNVLKIDMTYVTLILTLIGIYDVLNNPLMGIAYDRTRTRWGKARPYIMFSAIPYFASTALLYCGALFLGDKSGNDPRKIIFVFVMLFIQETLSTIYSIPRDNMISLQTANPKDRITVGLLNTYIGEFGSQMVYVIFLPLMELNNKGYINVPMPMIFAILSIFACSLGAVGNMAMAAGCKERIMLQPKPVPFTKTLFYMLKNKYLLRNFIVNFATSWWSSGGYSWDVVTQMEIFGGSVYGFLAYLPYNIVDIPSVALVPKFQKIFKGNNRNAYIVLRFWDLFCGLGMAVFGCPLVQNRWAIIGIYAFFYGLNGLNNGAANVFSAEVEREIADYTEYVSGERPDGTMNLIPSLITKITAPLNALLTVKLFKWSGYDSTIPMNPWSQGSKIVYQKVFFLFTAIHFLPDVVKMIPYFFYDLVGEKRERMYIALNERRALMAKEHSTNEAVEELMEAMEETGVEV